MTSAKCQRVATTCDARDASNEKRLTSKLVRLSSKLSQTVVSYTDDQCPHRTCDGFFGFTMSMTSVLAHSSTATNAVVTSEIKLK